MVTEPDYPGSIVTTTLQICDIDMTRTRGGRRRLLARRQRVEIEV